MSLTTVHADIPHRNRAGAGRRRGAVLEIALVNNMPDSAFLATERQFCSAVRGAVGASGARLHLFTLPSIARGGEAAKHIAAGYAAFGDLLARDFDALIVTGNEPRAPRLDAEPYWPDLAKLIDWADAHTRSSLWSCLAAHAAVLHLHGIARHRLPAKLSGVFRCRPRAQSALLAGFGTDSIVPHSRLNELRRDDLLARGYDILRESDEAGVDLFTLDKKSRFVFLQGHPEYETDTLSREYRRDVGRFLRGESDTYPDEPANYFSAEASAILRAFRRRAVANRDPALFDVFPNVVSPFAIANRWEPATLRLYGNWLAGVAAQKDARKNELATATSL